MTCEWVDVYKCRGRSRGTYQRGTVRLLDLRQDCIQMFDGSFFLFVLAFEQLLLAQ